MGSVNRVMLIGNLGKDPEVTSLPDGKAVCNFSMATSESWKDKNTGEKRESTEWHNCKCFGKLAEICGEYLHKGKQVRIVGKKKTRSYEKDGYTFYVCDVVFHEMLMLGNKSDSPRRDAEGYGPPEPQSYQHQDAVRPLPSYEDDIPF